MKKKQNKLSITSLMRQRRGSNVQAGAACTAGWRRACLLHKSGGPNARPIPEGYCVCVLIPASADAMVLGASHAFPNTAIRKTPAPYKRAIVRRGTIGARKSGDERGNGSYLRKGRQLPLSKVGAPQCKMGSWEAPKLT